MENSETSPSLPLPDKTMVRPSGTPGQLSEAARPSKHRDHLSKSPRRRREGKRLQRRRDSNEPLLWEIERRRLPGQHEHLEPSGSTSDAAESSPKRCALHVDRWSAVPQIQLCFQGHGVTWLLFLYFSFTPHRRAHFLHGPYPATHFGPKACILPNPTSVM